MNMPGIHMFTQEAMWIMGLYFHECGAANRSAERVIQKLHRRTARDKQAAMQLVAPFYAINQGMTFFRRLQRNVYHIGMQCIKEEDPECPNCLCVDGLTLGCQREFFTAPEPFKPQADCQWKLQYEDKYVLLPM